MTLNPVIDVFEGGEVCLGPNVVCDGFIDNLQLPCSNACSP